MSSTSKILSDSFCLEYTASTMQLIVQIIAAAAFKITLNKVAGFLFIYYVPPDRTAFGQLLLSYLFYVIFYHAALLFTMPTKDTQSALLTSSK